MPYHLIKRVKEVFRQVFQSQGGTGVGVFGDAPYNPAGKTGTAEEKIRVGDTVYTVQNLTLVGYAPFDEPEVAFAIVVPHTGIVTGQYNINLHIGRRILDEYFNLKEKRQLGDDYVEQSEENLDDDETENEDNNDEN